MYPNTRFEIIDESHIPKIETTEDYRPLFLYAITSDKGPEGLQKIRKDFSKIYGEVSFTRHGQPLLQADSTINAGGEILVKRVVAPDSTLANIVVVGKVKAGEQTQKKDSIGRLIYLLNGVETAYSAEDTVPPEATPVMIDTVDVLYEAQTVENVTSLSGIDLAVSNLPTEDENGYSAFPLFTIYDNGRGLSNKKFRISPDYDGSKTIDFLRYKLTVMENNSVLEEMLFSIDPERVYLNLAFGLDAVVNNNSLQIKSKMYDDNIHAFSDAIKTNSGEDLLYEDILFGRKRTSESIQSINIDENSVNLTNVFGVSLSSGSNGAFGEAPAKSESYSTELAKFFGGDLDDSIYDLVQYPIEVIIDANYTSEVKRKIEEFVTFREDIFYFQDMGMIDTIDQMKHIIAEGANNKFTGYYNIYYDIINPHTKKQVTVTCGYGLSKVLPNHLKYGRNRPVSGILNESILKDAIPGTVNFTPKVTPVANQKQDLDNIRCNYANWIDDQLVLQTQYTSQPEYTQLSFISNMLAIQQIIRAVRNRCPATRYSFIDGEDLETYQKDVQSVLNRYSDQFRELTFEYIQDDIMVQNKIFHAAIKVKFRDYVQAEYFKLYAIN